MFTDIVGSTEHAAKAGDRASSELLNRHQADVRRELARHRGAEVDTAGDGFCRFDGPARAIACARRIVVGANELGLQVRAGIHTGECELVGEKLAGIAVVTGARISSLAVPGEEHELMGVPGTWRIHAVATQDSRE